MLKEFLDNENESDEDDESLVSCESIFIIVFRFWEIDKYTRKKSWFCSYFYNI